MNPRRAALALSLCLLSAAGCARAPQVRTARAGVEQMAVLCKHCNCYMPADVDPESKCAVCECGYTAAKCVRGK